MLFPTITFAVFLTLVLAVHTVLLHRPRAWKLTMLLASYVFYGWWDWRFLSLIWISTLVDYGTGLAIAASTNRGRRRAFLALSLATNLGMLGFFKYADFFVVEFVNLLADLGITVSARPLGIILPVGISFYTFQTMSYSLDIHRGVLQPTRELRIAQIVRHDLFRPMRFHHFGDDAEPWLVYQEARIDRRRVRNDAQAQAGRAAAVGHRLAQVDDEQAADRSVPRSQPFEPLPHPRYLTDLPGEDQTHAAFGKGHELAVEQIACDRFVEADFARRNLDDLHVRDEPLKRGVEMLALGKRLLVRQQHIFVRDGDDIVVERTRRHRLLRLRDGEDPLRIEPVQPCHRAARLDVLTHRKSAASLAVHEDLDARPVMGARDPHMVRRAFVGEGGGDRFVDREMALVAERQLELL